MPKRKSRDAQPAPPAKPRDRKRVAIDGSDVPQLHANLVDLSTLPNLNPPSREAVSTHQNQPAALNREQLDEVTHAVIAAMSSMT